MAENINALSAERNRLRVRVEELNKLFADVANERDQALSQLEQCRKQLAGENRFQRSEMTKKLKTKAWPDGREWPDELTLDVGNDMPMDVYGIHPRHFGVLYIRHDVAAKAFSELEALQSQLADIRQHSAQSDKELCQLQDALGCPCESRNYFCYCGWRGYNHHKCPKCGKETHDDGMADAQALCMERIRDFVMAEDENKNLRAQNRELREAVEEVMAHPHSDPDGNYVTWIGEGTFLKCTQALALSQPEAGKV